MNFKAGTFQKDAVSPALRHFCPLSAVHSLTEIDLQALWTGGKRLLLLDVDNTLVAWKTEDFSQETLNWLSKAKELGFELCILSNTRHPDRLERISKQLDIPAIRDRFKPSVRMYLMALERFQKGAEEALMIGDQILTDILGANRAGVEAIWVHRIAEREFIGTRLVSRKIEAAIVGTLNRALPVAAKLPEPTGAAEDLPIKTQIFRFAVVGASSFVIDSGVLILLSSVLSFQGHKIGVTTGNWAITSFPSLFGHYTMPEKAAAAIFKPVSTFAAMINSFYWNRRWTFGITDTEDRKRQFGKFVALNVGGIIIATTIVAILVNTVSILAAQIGATVVQAVWNFGGQRLWAFRKK